MEKHVALSFVLFAILGCGRTIPTSTDFERTPLSVSDAGALCVENGDCGAEEVCLQNACVFFGECLRDFHCATTGGCVENKCEGEYPTYEEGEPISCEINADCPDRHVCVSDACRLGVECLMHAHCDVGKACVGRLCVDAF
jgi:hypothetical protein